MKNKDIIILNTKNEVKEYVASCRKKGMSIGLVPTMGSLHEGHLSLVDESLKECDRTIATIFVNPIQFNAGEDFESYPVNEEEDVRKLNDRGCNVVFIPSLKEIFPNGEKSIEEFNTLVEVKDPSKVLCGVNRPGHFIGVATEVLKFLMITLSDYVYLGEKDFQQFKIISRMVEDLNIPVEVKSVETARENDGLAYSSRNQYLAHDERKVASLLYKSLKKLAENIKVNPDWAQEIEKTENELLKAGFSRIDYISVMDEEDLYEVSKLNNPVRLFIAAWLGQARLIDNIRVLPK